MSEAEKFRQAVEDFRRATARLHASLARLRITVWATLGVVAAGILGTVLFRLLAQ